MFKNIIILAVSMFAFNAAATDISTTYFSDGSSVTTYDHGSTAQTYHSDGSSAITYKNGNNTSTYYSDGTSSINFD